MMSELKEKVYYRDGEKRYCPKRQHMAQWEVLESGKLCCSRCRCEIPKKRFDDLVEYAPIFTEAMRDCEHDFKDETEERGRGDSGDIYLKCQKPECGLVRITKKE